MTDTLIHAALLDSPSHGKSMNYFPEPSEPGRQGRPVAALRETDKIC